MKKTMMAIVLISCMLIGTTLGETISFNGIVEASESVLVKAPIGGTVEEVPVVPGEKVTPDTVIARIQTNKVYATQAGTVTAVYGQPGDDVEKVAATWGAVMYLEGETMFTVSASTSRAYDDKANYIVHSGERVYLVSRNHTLDKGEGIISEVTDASFTVQVTSGDFYVGDSVDVFREESALAASRIGRGTVSRVAPEAVSGSGSIVSFAVSAGEQVRRGQLLFETADGTFAGLEMTGTDIAAGTDGTIASLNVEQGSTLNADGAVAVIYPKNAMRVAVEVPEADLKELTAGQKVRVELDWNQDDGVSYEGTVDMISALGTVGEESTVYTMYVSFQPDENTRYGMTAIVTTLEEEEQEEPDSAHENTEANNADSSADVENPGNESGKDDTPGEDRRGDGERPSGGRPGRDGTGQDNSGKSETNDAD